jgi:hypothetical protein
MKFSFDCDHLFHDECGNSITNIDQCGFMENMLRLLKFLDITMSQVSTYIYVVTKHVHY